MTEYTKCCNPATGEEIGQSPLNTTEELFEAVAMARRAQITWAATPPKKRAKTLLALRPLLLERADALARTISEENGKTRVDALATEILPCAMAVGYYCKMAPKWLKERKLKNSNPMLFNKKSYLGRVPYGVTGVISPWNYPLAIPFSEVLMSLLAGNAVVLKVARQTQKVGRMLEQLFLDCGLPKKLFTYVNLPGAVAGAAFFEAGVDKLFFTGSVAVGKELAALAAARLTPVSLELGGNDAMIVCADANIARAVSGAVWAGFQNAGQSCGGVERIYVHADVYDQFLTKLRAAVELLRVGRDTDFNVDIGCLTTASQRATVEAHIQEALQAGATLYASSGAPTGSDTFHPCVVLTDVNHTMRVMREETFGPVVGVMRVSSDDEAISLANDSNLGLTASVWSADSRKAHAMASRIQAGAVTINDHLMSHGLPETPWGGFKESGIGRTHGALGFEEMTQPQVIVHDLLGGARANLWWHPHDRTLYEGLLGILKTLYSNQRGRGAKNLARILPNMFKER